MDRYVITISREFGSGGRLIGEKLASRLGVEFYDKAIIQMAAERSGLSYKFIGQNEENLSNRLLFNFPAATAYTDFKTAAFFDTPGERQDFPGADRGDPGARQKQLRHRRPLRRLPPA